MKRVITKMEAYSQWASAPELPLGGFMPSDDPIQVRNIDGIGPVKADITTTEYASGRGALLNGTSTGQRNIVLTLGLNPDWTSQSMSSLREMLYAYFMPEQWTKLRFFRDDYPPADIEGWVESFEPNIFSQDPEIQVSIICPKPDFVEADATILTGTVDDGSTENVFNYVGNVATGFELKVESSAAKAAYTGNLVVITKSPTLPQTFEVDGVTVDATKYFKLSSVQNGKQCMNVAEADGALTNLLELMTDESVWPMLNPGENSVTIAAASPGQTWTLAYFNRFGGL